MPVAHFGRRDSIIGAVASGPISIIDWVSVLKQAAISIFAVTMPYKI
jgi:hypothetical protein